MIDFEKELKKFVPSEEIDSESTKVDTEKHWDITDVLMELLKD